MKYVYLDSSHRTTCMSSLFITIYNLVREGNVFSRICQSVCPYVATVNLFKLIHLGSLPDLFKLVYCVTHISISKRVVVLQLKGLLVLHKILQQSLWLHGSRRFRPITFQGQPCNIISGCSKISKITFDAVHYFL